MHTFMKFSLLDRSIRPLFLEGYAYDTQVYKCIYVCVSIIKYNKTKVKEHVRMYITSKPKKYPNKVGMDTRATIKLTSSTQQE